MNNGCQAGCKVFTGGEVKHHPDCQYYPESFSKLYDDLRTEVKKLRKSVVVPSLPLLMNPNDGWHFDYQLISTLKQKIEETGEEISMEQIDAVLLALYQRQ